MADDAHPREELEDMQEIEKLRACLSKVIDTLSDLTRDQRVKIITCTCRFFELPRSE